MTTQYWIWKNIKDVDYIGFFTDSRFLSLTSSNDPLYQHVKNFEELKKFGYSGEITGIDNYEAYVPATDTGIQSTNYKIYEKSHNIKDLEIVLKILKMEDPDKYKIVEKYLKDDKGHYSYSFIMEKSVFNDYSTWLFSILEKYDSICQLSLESKDKQAPRHLAERLLGAYIEWMYSNGHNIKECQIVMVDNDKPASVEPVFEITDCAIVASSSNEYIPYFSAMLESIIDHSNSEKNYDIIVLTKYISERNQERVLSQVNGHPNISVRFFDISGLIKEYKSLPTHNNIEIETYFRYFIPEILNKYSKVVYLDSDMTVLTDLTELYDMDLKDNYLLATIDADFAGCYNHIDGRKEYIDLELKINNPYTYFQSGVMLLNLNKFRRELSAEELLNYSGKRHWIHLDQDVLNYYCQGSVGIIDMSWDVMYDFKNWRSYIVPYAPHYIHDEYLKARKNPKIVHYAGEDKPWNYPDVDFAEYFWKYARKSPFYEIMIANLANSR